MQMPKNISTILWSAAGGAVATMIVGFSWGGWVTGGSARTAQTSASHDAVVVALAPICADRFRAQSDSATKIAELAKSSWDRGNVVASAATPPCPAARIRLRRRPRLRQMLANPTARPKPERRRRLHRRPSSPSTAL
jgi:hypothetical protein